MTLKRAQLVGLSVDASPLIKASFLGAMKSVKIIVGKAAITKASMRFFNSFLCERSCQKISNAHAAAATNPSFLVKLISPKNTMLSIFNFGFLYFSAKSKDIKADKR